jgi:hypothetical protein
MPGEKEFGVEYETEVTDMRVPRDNRILKRKGAGAAGRRIVKSMASVL